MKKIPLVYKNMIFLVMIFFLPSFGYVALKSSSLALGFLISLLVIWIFSFESSINLRTNNNFKIISLLFLIHSLLIMLFGSNFDFNKATGSFFLLIFVILSAALFNQKLEKIDSLLFIKILNICTMIILSFGIFSIFFKINIFGYENYAKSIFPFAEPRHFVTATGSIIFTSSLYYSNYGKLFVAVLIPLFIFTFQSVTLAVYFLMFFFFLFFIDIKRQTSTIFLSLVGIFIIFFFIGDADYFLSRLDFSSQNTNLTALIFLQGWDEIFHSLRLTNGYGVGFQNMGNLDPSPISLLIKSLSGGFYMNRNDGSFLASKIISEFGMLGIFFVLLFLKRFFMSFIFIIKFIISNKNFQNNHQVKPLIVFAHINITFFIIEMFVAGTGYFSSGVFLFIVSTLLLQSYALTRNNIL